MAKEKKATGEAPKKRASRKKAPVAGAEVGQPPVSAAGSDNGKSESVLSPIAAEPKSNVHSMDADEVRRRAYEIWEQRGRQHGKHEDDWYRAEQELRGKSA